MSIGLGHEVWGTGAIRVVALHGFTGNRSAWAHLRPFWQDRCTVLAVDLPGHGETPLAAGPGFEETLDKLVALIERRGFAGANLLGYSLGARLALGLAVARPDLPGRLVLESGSPGLRRRKARGERRRTDEELASSIERDGLEPFVSAWEALPLFSGLRQLSPELQASLRARRMAADPGGLAGSLRTLGLGVQPNYWPALPLLRVPTLLITGGRDAKFTETARRMAAELPMAWRRTFPDVGHCPHLEAAEEYAAEVVRFLETPWIEAPLVDRETGSM